MTGSLSCKGKFHDWAWMSLSNHKQRGYIIIISVDELTYLAEKASNCFICNCLLRWGYGKKGHAHNDSPTLDRINNEMEVRSDNIQIVCHRCNMIKGDRPFDVFVKYCKDVSDKFKPVGSNT